jgi:alpha-tubulin suppressor-like RCC1 family protein
MPILNKDIIETKFQETIDSYSNTTNSLSLLVSFELTEKLQSEKVPNLTTLTLPENPSGNNHIVYLTDIENFVIYNGNGWYTFDGFLIPNQNRLLYSWSSSPVSVDNPFIDWCQVSDGFVHRAAIRTNGTLWTWGCNQCGRLGDGTTVDKVSPVSVIGGFTDWCQVSAGIDHTAAVRTNGTLWAWGPNLCGVLGDGTTVSKSSPVSVVGGISDWCQVAAGSNHTAAVRINGTLWAWGCAGNGRLGDNTAVNKSSPVQISGTFCDWCQVSAGQAHTVALRTNGTLWSWGIGTGGMLGNNCTTDRSSPVSVVGGFTDWCQVSAGREHTAAVRTNGTLWTWGCNGGGRLGDGTTTSRNSPVSVIGGFINWCQVSGGRANTAAVRTDGTLWTWGCNQCGRLGDGTTVDKSSPVSVIGGFTDWSQVSMGTSQTSALRTCQVYL